MSKKKSTTKRAEPQVHMGEHPSKVGWWDGEKYIPYNEMSDTYLQRAKMHVQKMQLVWYNKINTLYDLEQRLDEEAKKRGKSLRDYPSQMHRNNRVLKEAMKKEESNEKGK